MIAEDRPRLGRAMSPGWRDRPSARRRCVPATQHDIADDDRPAVAGDRLPRAARRDPPPLGHPDQLRRRPSGRPARRATSGSPAIASSSAGEQRRPRHDRVDLEVLRRRMVVAADRPEPVEARHAHARGRVGVGRAAGRRVARSRTRAPPATRRAWSTRRPLRSSFSIGHQRAIGSSSTVVSGHLGRRGDAADLRLGRLERLARRCPDVDLERAALGDDVGPRPAGDHADVDGHARPAAVERVQVARRSAPPRGSRCDPSPARRRRAPRGRGRRCAGRGCPCAPTRCRRWRGRTRGRARHRCRRPARGCAASRSASRSPRPGWRRTRAARTGSPPPLGDERLERVQPGQQAGLHVGDARAVGDAVVDPERPLGGGARVEDRVHVADQQERAARRRGRGTSRSTRVAEAAGRVRPRLDRGTEAARGSAATQRPTSSTPAGV